MRVLIVDDSERLREALRSGLGSMGLAVDVAADGRAALAFLDAGEYDVIVLDLLMPRLDGREVLREVRRRGLDARVLVLSALDGVDERVGRLDDGADDYLVKPFSFDELRARVLALARRRHEQPLPVLEHRGLRLDTARRTVGGPGGTIDLGPKEYALLEVLVRHPGRVYSRAQLFERLYSADSEASDKVIEVLLSTLRAKLARGGLEDVIETRRGFGYAAR
ncbi:response regulator transcription factor [Luteimonas granuli]|uniref:Response regulator transcription factor n=1 Tax=Luteimonas granuli TaxID=1176533 RepID=A0A518N117_9GAMM|nr:response regulator transcription factor [Luteimonas granuli]QDW65610.1 response regulator transcription factor [Luteimonas granuli]